MIAALRTVIKRMHYPLEVMLTCVRWYVSYPLSFRHLEEMMEERGVVVDHATIHRWAIKIVPVLAAVFRRCKRPLGTSWRMDETYIKVHGQWKYLYRAVARDGDTIDFLLRAKRDKAAARRFLEQAIALHGEPHKITIDQSGANTAAIENYNADHHTRHRATPVQVSQQYRRARSSGYQTNRTADARVQGLSLRPHPHCRHRNDAHDPQGADRLP
jgi:transposase-like protein